MSSASRCSFTITARRRIAKAPAAPGRTSSTPATSRRASAFRISCLITRAAFAARHRSICGELRQRRNAGALRLLQPVHQVRRSFRHRPRPRRRRARDRTLHRLARRRRRRPRALSRRKTLRAIRAISCSRRRKRSSRCCVFRSATGKSGGARTRRQFGLAVAEKPDSQDICFVPSGRYTDVVERLRAGRDTAGEIVHLDGRVLGRHAGVMHYTVGQRRGLGLSAAQSGATASRCSWSAWTPRAPKSSSGRARRWRPAPCSCAT